MIVHFSVIRLNIEYGDVTYSGSALKDLTKLDKIQRESMLVVPGGTWNYNFMNLECNWQSLTEWRGAHCLTVLLKIIFNKFPANLYNMFLKLTNSGENP